eukprot:TRINITY_DN5423_c0_g1_i1.p1 TRINITY_DN5423_c0_g1~~TRINITY_DN5423_c0_g1_i1.p1  ORF type:complete len:550 (+),score=151.13 TRINITY_DN5423_c0_g1_i1:176-1825(+)
MFSFVNFYNILLSVLFLCFSVSFYVFYRAYMRRKYVSLNVLLNIPGPEPTSYLSGHLKDLLKEKPLQAHMKWLKLAPTSPLIRYSFLTTDRILVVTPEGAQRVLTKNSNNYTKEKLLGYKRLKLVLGDGLITLAREDHKIHRRLIEKAFHTKYLKQLVPMFSRQTKCLLKRWDEEYIKGRSEETLKEGIIVPVQQEVTELTLAIIGLAAFDFDLTGGMLDKSDAYREIEINSGISNIGKDVATTVFRLLGSLTLRKATAFIPFYHHLPLEHNKERIRDNKMIYDVVSDIIENKCKHIESLGKEEIIDKKRYKDLLELLIMVRCETGEGLSDQELVDEVKTFLFAGHETTTTLITWTLYLLSREQEVQNKCAKEIHETFDFDPSTDKIEDKEINYNILQELIYLSYTIKESLRILPPIPMVTRYCREDDYLCDFLIPAGTQVMISPYVIHHNPEVWDEPKKFDPMRWTPDKCKKRHPYSFIPFLMGRRNCIGQRFAMIEAKMILSMLLAKYKFEPPTDDDSEIDASLAVTLRPTDLLKLKISLREPFINK